MLTCIIKYLTTDNIRFRIEMVSMKIRSFEYSTMGSLFWNFSLTGALTV